MDNLEINIETVPFNKAVRKAYFQILAEAKTLLKGIDREELRYTLSREIKPAMRNMPVHEFISPLLYLKLSCENNNRFVIHYGFECSQSSFKHSDLTASFTRLLYRRTAKEHTKIDIECCVQTDWIITECSALYEFKEDMANYQFTLIKKEGGSWKRKSLQAVA